MSGRVFSGLGFLQNIGRHMGFECYPRSGIGQNLARIPVGKEKSIRNSTWEKFGMRDSHEKKSGNAGSGSPFSDASLGQHFRGGSWRRRPTHLLEVSHFLFFAPAEPRNIFFQNCICHAQRGVLKRSNICLWCKMLVENVWSRSNI